MENLNAADIAKIAEELDGGLKVFIHKTTNEILSMSDPDEDDDSWQDEIKKLKASRSSFHQIKPMTSRESFEVMEAFAQQVTDENHLQSRLLDALRRRKPFQEFRRELNYSETHLDNWYAFRKKSYEDFVEQQLQRLKSTKH
jgi:hypothetical protein